MSFRLVGNGGDCRDCQWIQAEGDIMPGSSYALEKFIKAGNIPQDILIRFDSLGGSLYDGMMMGYVIRNAGLRTTVGRSVKTGEGSKRSHEAGRCASACAYAFLGGVERTITGENQIGVHQFYSDVSGKGTGDVSAVETETQDTITGLAHFATEMGVSRDIVFAAAATRPYEIYWLERDALEIMQVVTDITPQ